MGDEEIDLQKKGKRDFKKVWFIIMIRDCSFEKRHLNCGNCVHVSTNGWIAPAMNCAKGEKGCYQYIDNKHCGTTCEFFKGRNEYFFTIWKKC